MSENKQKAIIALLAINAVLVLYFGTSLGKRLTEEKNHITSQISNVNNMVSYLEGRIISNMQSLLNARDNMVEKTSYTYIDIDAENKKAVISFTVDLREVKPNSEIFLAYSSEKGSNIKELKLEKIGALTYGVETLLNLDENYQYDLIERVAGGGEALLNTDKQYVSLYNDFYQNRIQIYESGYSHSRDEAGVSFGFSVNSFGMDEFELDGVVLEVLYDNEVIDSIDVTNSIIHNSNSEVMHHYNKAIASGEIDDSISLQDFAKKYGYEGQPLDDREQYFLSHTIKFSDYELKNTELEFNSSGGHGHLRMNLIITCKDGFTFRAPGLG
jgi:hypothetical protein